MAGQPCTIADIEAIALKQMSKTTSQYYNSGAMDMITYRDNEEAYNRYKIRPRILMDVGTIDTSTTLFGQEIRLPFGFAPAAMHCLAHPDGEAATSRAAAATGIPMALSTYSTISLEEVIAQSNGNPYAFQLTVVQDRDITLGWIRRAEKSGYKALFLTVDAPVLGHRLVEWRNDFQLPDHLSFPNIRGKRYVDENGKEQFEPLRSYRHGMRDATNSWSSTIPWLKSVTKLEIWLKGVYTPEDVYLAIHHGLNGVVISNHGGRQLDGAPATIDALYDCAIAAKGQIKVGIDGGIRRGSDIFKALALGADVCFMGRVPLYGLGYNGQEGVEEAVRILEKELRTTMALTGCKSLKDISLKHLAVIGSNGLLCKL